MHRAWVPESEAGAGARARDWNYVQAGKAKVIPTSDRGIKKECAKGKMALWAPSPPFLRRFLLLPLQLCAHSFRPPSLPTIPSDTVIGLVGRWEGERQEKRWMMTRPRT